MCLAENKGLCNMSILLVLIWHPLFSYSSWAISSKHLLSNSSVEVLFVVSASHWGFSKHSKRYVIIQFCNIEGRREGEERQKSREEGTKSRSERWEIRNSDIGRYVNTVQYKSQMEVLCWQKLNDWKWYQRQKVISFLYLYFLNTWNSLFEAGDRHPC